MPARLPRPGPPSRPGPAPVALSALGGTSLLPWEEAAASFPESSNWLGAKVVVSVVLVVLAVCICLCAKRLFRGRTLKVSFKITTPGEDECDEEPVDDALWERGVARQTRWIARDPPRRARRATRSLHEGAEQLRAGQQNGYRFGENGYGSESGYRYRPGPDGVTSPEGSPSSSLASRLKLFAMSFEKPVEEPVPETQEPVPKREVIAKPVIDFVKKVDHAAKESPAGKVVNTAVNKAVESTLQQAMRADHAVKESPAGRAVNTAVELTTQQVKESPAGKAVTKAVQSVYGLLEPFPEAVQAYVEPDANMPAPPSVYWRHNAPPYSPSASRRAARENAKIRSASSLPPPVGGPGASKELV